MTMKFDFNERFEVGSFAEAAHEDGILHSICRDLIPLEIELSTQAIKEALWQVPADMDRAKRMISRRMGLRICAGEKNVKLKPVPEHLRKDFQATDR